MKPFSHGICCDTIVTIDEIRIPDGIDYKFYEVMRISDKKILYFDQHMDRLETSVKSRFPEFILDREKIQNLIRELMAYIELENVNVRIEGYLDENTMCHMIGYLVHGEYPDEHMYSKGVLVKTLALRRNNPNVKAIDKNYKELVDEFIRTEDVYEALLWHEGRITEGTRSNVFLISKGIVYASLPKDVLSGITKQKVVETLSCMAVPYIEKEILVSELEHYEAAFLTGTSIHILPIAQLDDKIFDVNNKLLRRIMSEFNTTVQSYLTE
jgi:branched-chain amino acid aminotransferase